MAMPINQRQLRNDSGQIMRRVEQGESFTITRNGTPVADLVPHVPHVAGRSSAAGRFVSVDVIGSSLASLPTWGAVAFGEDVEDLDQSLDDHDLDRWNEQHE